LLTSLIAGSLGLENWTIQIMFYELFEPLVGLVNCEIGCGWTRFEMLQINMGTQTCYLLFNSFTCQPSGNVPLLC
jgi:hypothetical protein